jgi:hypothetical protein
MGKLVRIASATAGPIEQIAVVQAGSLSVTAIRNGAGNLEVIVWSVLDEGGTHTFVRGGQGIAGVASDISITVMPTDNIYPYVVVTAFRNGSGLLELISWEITPDGKTVKRSGTAVGSAMSRVAIAPIDVAPLNENIHLRAVATAVRNADGRLEVTTWQMANDGESITREKTVIGNPITAVCALSAGVNAGALESSTVTFVGQLADGHLFLNSWAVAWNGTTISELTQTTAGQITGAVAAKVASIGEAIDETAAIASVVSSPDGTLKLIVWTQDLGYGDWALVRVTDASGGSYLGDLAIGAVGGQRFVIGGRDSEGNLALRMWQYGTSTGLVYEGSFGAGAITSVAMDIVQSSLPGLVTAVRTGAGNLEMIAWEVVE